MATEVLAWNVADGFGDITRRGYLIESVKRADADVAVFPEAYAENTEQEALEEVAHAFGVEGYRVFTAAYHDTDARKDRHGLLAISRLAGTMAVRSMVSRNAVELHVHDDRADAELAIFGVHLDDRHEARRVQQSRVLLDAIAYSRRTQEKPVVVMGDFNSMHKNDTQAKALRSMRGLANQLPARNPGEPQTKIQRIGSILQRLSGMASGTTMELYKNAGFVDADLSHRATMIIPGTRHDFVQLDHILARNAVALNHQVLPYSDLSDHRAIRATVYI